MGERGEPCDMSCFLEFPVYLCSRGMASRSRGPGSRPPVLAVPCTASSSETQFLSVQKGCAPCTLSMQVELLHGRTKVGAFN